MIGTSAQSIENGVMPVEAYLRDDHKATSEEVGIFGLLAYTADCGLAIYSTPDAAIRRAEDMAIRLGSKSDEVSFSIDSNGLSDYIGRFIYAKGSAVTNSSRSSFSNNYQSDSFSCVRRYEVAAGCALHEEADA